MLARLFALVALAAPFVVQPVLAREAPAVTTPQTPMAAPATKAPAAAAPAAKAPSPGQAAARDRQKTCGAQWRALADAEKVAQGPKWPQYWSKCNKRLKGEKA